jgi:hypothetical protein
MDCGAEELLCRLIEWLSHNAYAVRQTLEFLDTLWSSAGGQIADFLRDHGEKLIALLSFSFAVWRWWRYREGILHKRLEEYIRESDARLGPASDQTMEAILRPGRTAALPQPAFAVELRDILDTNGWGTFFRFSSVERHAERQFGRTLRRMRNRQRIARAATQSLHDQQARVHLLAGAVAASRARRTTDSRRASLCDHAALREFQKVLQFPAHHRDVVAKECEAFQLLRLRKHAEAARAYLELEEFAGALPDQRQRDLVVARAKRFRAQIRQAKQTNGGSLRAWTLIASIRNPECAVQLRARYGAYESWEAIEQAEIHFVSAWIASKLGYVVEEQDHLSNAEENYCDVLGKVPRRAIFVSFPKRALRDEASAGRDRVRRARAGQYDQQWLMV